MDLKDLKIFISAIQKAPSRRTDKEKEIIKEVVREAEKELK